MFRRQLRQQALVFLSDERLAPRVRRLLAKLNERWRAEAAEIMILANDMSEPFARALVAATPAPGLQGLRRSRTYNADPQRHRAMTAERDYLLRKAKPAFASFGRNALDLVAVEAFVRRLIAMPTVVAWLELQDRNTFHILSCVH